MKFSIFTYLPVLILTPKSCQDLLFIVYICIGFLWSSRSQILKELDGLDLSSNPVQSSPIQSLNLPLLDSITYSLLRTPPPGWSCTDIMYIYSLFFHRSINTRVLHIDNWK